MFKRNGIKGFTLIEILMAIVLIGIISTVAGMLLYQGTRSFGSLDNKRELFSQGALALERLSREMRLVRCTVSGNNCMPQNSDITSMTASEFRFVNDGYEGRGIRFDAGTLKLRQGSNPADPEDILANNVAALTFEYLKKDGTAASAVTDVWIINANLTFTSGGNTIDLKASVHPRNFR